MLFVRTHKNSVDSTSLEARRLWEKGSYRESFVVYADQQTLGQGRYGRTWESPVGNFYGTFVWCLENGVKRSVLGLYSLAAAVAVSETLEHWGGEVACKWPNDVYAKGKKISGLLLELFENSLATWGLFVGIGVNLLTVPRVLESSYGVVSLREILADQERAAPLPTLVEFLDVLEQKLFRRFTEVEKAGEGILAAWLKRAWKLDEEITVRVGKELVHGIFQGITAEGHLVLGSANTKDKDVRIVEVGEVFPSLGSKKG